MPVSRRSESDPTSAGNAACSSAPAAPLRELALLFLKLGATSFGGPAVHIALLENEVVRRRRWLTHAEFLDLLGAANLIPGPNSTELAIHIGLKRGGWRGLLLAGLCFIAPAFLITFACAWLYVRYGQTPRAAGLLYGVKPVVLAIVLQAIWRLGATLRGKAPVLLLAALVFICGMAGVHELILLLGAGAAALMLSAAHSGMRPTGTPLICLLPMPVLPLGAITVPASAPAAVGLWPLFAFFLKIGCVLYGSGYVLLAFLQADLVDRWHWLSQSQLLDAIAIGQVTPGPLFTTATFIGYLLAGGSGACLATLGIFLPAFVFVALSAPLVPRLRRSSLAGSFLDGVNAASLALMALATVRLAGGAFIDTPTACMGLAAGALLIFTRINPIWMILAAATLGLALH